MDDTHKSSEQQDMTTKKRFQGASPEEVKERVKETVSKGVAAVAGALKGFSEQARDDDLAGSTKQAIQKAGETTREIAGTAKSEFRQTRGELKGSSSTPGVSTLTDSPLQESEEEGGRST